jgi:hypothetical protein
MISGEEMELMKKSFGRPTELWKKAFKEYNDDTTNLSLSMYCRSCWFKVLKYHEKRITTPI